MSRYLTAGKLPERSTAMSELSMRTLIFVCIFGAGILFMIVSFFVSLIIAKKHDIILVKPNIDKHWYFSLVVVILFGLLFVETVCTNSHHYRDLVNDFKIRGIEAYAEYVGTKQLKFDTADEEQEFLNGKIAEYEEDARKERQKNMDDNWRNGACFSGYLCVFLLESTFVTRSGLLHFGHFKPREFKAKIEDDEICLYIDKIKAPQLKLRATEKNLRLMSEYIAEEKTDIPKPEPERIFNYHEPV